MLLDENPEAEGQEFFSVDTFDISNSQQLLAWSVDLDGGEKYTLRFRDLDTGVELPMSSTTSPGAVLHGRRMTARSST